MAKVTEITDWITPSRFREYLVAANHDSVAARELYEWNIAVSSGFFELMSHVEVALRNAVDGILQPLEVKETARIAPQEGWWFGSSTFLAKHELDYFEKAMRHLRGKDTGASRDKAFASMTFGLWADIFKPSYDELFRRHLVYAFPNRGEGFSRKVVSKNVLDLKNLRNRIAHHQAIFDLPLEERFEQAMDLLRWIDPLLEEWVLALCRVRDLLDSRPKAAESIAVIVPARQAWEFYVKCGAYICQPGRYFRQISHLGFYANGAVQREVPKILERIPSISWAPEEISRRMASGTEQNKRIAGLIREGRKRGWEDDQYQLFLLTRPDSHGYGHGHVTLGAELSNQKTGRGSAWVRRQRYVGVKVLKSAKSLSDLDPQ